MELIGVYCERCGRDGLETLERVYLADADIWACRSCAYEESAADADRDYRAGLVHSLVSLPAGPLPKFPPLPTLYPPSRFRGKPGKAKTRSQRSARPAPVAAASARRVAVKPSASPQTAMRLA